MTAIILTYYENRRKYLPMIIECLKNSSVECDIVVFNQGIPLDDIPGVTVINSGKNFGCSVRQAVALAMEDDIFFFQDDDLLVSPEVIGKMRQHLTDHNVVGVTGCRLTDGYYTSAEQVKETTASVDIVTGRLHMCKKKPIIEAFKLRDQLGLKIWREDDILLSLAASGNMVVDAEIWNLDEENIGLSHEPQHYQERNKVCKTIYEFRRSDHH